MMYGHKNGQSLWKMKKMAAEKKRKKTCLMLDFKEESLFVTPSSVLPPSTISNTLLLIPNEPAKSKS